MCPEGGVHGRAGHQGVHQTVRVKTRIDGSTTKYDLGQWWHINWLATLFNEYRIKLNDYRPIA